MYIKTAHEECAVFYVIGNFVPYDIKTLRVDATLCSRFSLEVAAFKKLKHIDRPKAVYPAPFSVLVVTGQDGCDGIFRRKFATHHSIFSEITRELVLFKVSA